MRRLARRRPARFPASHRDREHRQRQRCQRDPRLEGVVAPDELQVDRQRDQHPAQRHLLQEDPGRAGREQLRPEQRRIEQRGLPGAFAPNEPVDEPCHPRHADRKQRSDRFAALLPDEHADDQPAHPDHRESRADSIDRPIARIRHVADTPRPRQHGQDDQALHKKPGAPREDSRDEASQQRPDRGRDRSRGADQRKDPRTLLPLEVAVDQRLHRREVERGAETPDDSPENDDRAQALREDHRTRPNQIEEQAGDKGALPAEEIADLAADQDERGRHQRLDRHRRLDPAHRRIQVVDDSRDRDVHKRRVDHEHEHRRRQEDPKPRVAAFLIDRAHARNLLGYRTTGGATTRRNPRQSPPPPRRPASSAAHLKHGNRAPRDAIRASTATSLPRGGKLEALAADVYRTAGSSSGASRPSSP